MESFPKYIAEISSNHSQDMDRIMKFIEVSASIGCDAVKFQLFEVEELFSPEAIKHVPAVLERKQWELPIGFFPDIKKECLKHGLLLGCTPFYLEAVHELEEFLDFYKIASYELLWLDLIEECAKKPQPLIISSGMANIDELFAVSNLLKVNNKKNVAFLHCESSYPVRADEANLASISFMEEKLGFVVGWSDHSCDPAVILRAANKWDAQVFEFHLDLDATGAEYSSGHCWLPEDLSNVISLIERGKLADGTKYKCPGKNELTERDWRADPSDGLRPLKKLRKKLCDETSYFHRP